MTGTAHEILDIFLAFRTKQIQRAAWQNTMRQMAALPQHLVADVDPYAAAAAERDLISRSFNKPDGINKIYSFE
ncbi:hypothetical protein HGP14_16430 [Rhizobium sp. P32RR-XVIII]|uniref:hypothetical protein n=1 Tax=Rhizobium sp. P32RR-XVIII TaxID=2726738 RepID=UPI001456A212|nr:hypothetical protein [Rhizobium sp. P32RR-XVIII]NLS04932.1 hypothetical protein [Rhizobium sp. P32RR-XVIII]